MMKFSDETLAILKNFQNINNSILVRKGNVLSTVAESRFIQAKYECAETFELECGIGSLGKLLSVFSMFDDVDVQFKEKYLLIRSGQREARIRYTEPDNIKSKPKGDIKLPSIDVELDITEEQVRTVLKLTTILGLTQVAIIGDGTSMYLSSINTKDQNSDTFRTEIGPCDKKFTAAFLNEAFKIIPGNYRVQLSTQGISKFTLQPSEKLVYWIAMDHKGSEF